MMDGLCGFILYGSNGWVLWVAFYGSCSFLWFWWVTWFIRSWWVWWVLWFTCLYINGWVGFYNVINDGDGDSCGYGYDGICEGVFARGGFG